jgi:hypothetical protein
MRVRIPRRQAYGKYSVVFLPPMTVIREKAAVFLQQADVRPTPGNLASGPLSGKILTVRRRLNTLYTTVLRPS